MWYEEAGSVLGCNLINVDSSQNIILPLVKSLKSLIFIALLPNWQHKQTANHVFIFSFFSAALSLLQKHSHYAQHTCCVFVSSQFVVAYCKKETNSDKSYRQQDRRLPKYIGLGDPTVEHGLLENSGRSN